ncbi:MAG: hypothetical protein ABSD73_06260 [Candidatus Bathyarchaeia archaeon]|jgi:hypothetical protein
MGDHELFQLEDNDIKQTSRDLVLVWRQFDRLIDIEAPVEKK